MDRNVCFRCKALKPLRNAPQRIFAARWIICVGLKLLASGTELEVNPSRLEMCGLWTVWMIVNCHTTS